MLKKILNNKVFKIVYGTIRTLFIIMMVLYVGTIVIQKATNNSSISGFRCFTIASLSMYPVYNINDVIVVKEVDTNTLTIGDDITYYGTEGDMKDKIITHRIININDGKFQTQGTSNPTADPVIDANQIYGKVVYKPTIISLISKIVKNQYGFFFLVFAPLILVIFLEVADTIIEGREEKEK